MSKVNNLSPLTFNLCSSIDYFLSINDIDTLHRLVKMQTRDREELILDVNRFKFKSC